MRKIKIKIISFAGTHFPTQKQVRNIYHVMGISKKAKLKKDHTVGNGRTR